jgi:hypothetical protein
MTYNQWQQFSAMQSKSEEETVAPSLSNGVLPSMETIGYQMKPFVSANATVVSAATTLQSSIHPPKYVVTRPGHTFIALPPTVNSEQHNELSSIRSTIKVNDAVLPTHSVPEFLCHILNMVQDPSLCNVISWEVPTQDEPEENGGGIKGIGKVVVYNPQRFQDFVLGKYYRHSRFSSFQRQMNYFGFKKRIHGAKKRKMCACSFINENLGAEPQSLLLLKRRHRGSKHYLEDVEDCSHGKEKMPYLGVTRHCNTIKSEMNQPAESSSFVTEDKERNCARPNDAVLINGTFLSQSLPCPFQPQSSINITNSHAYALNHSNIANEIDTVNLAAREAKQSLLEAYQKSKMELLQKELDGNKAESAKPTPLAAPHLPLFGNNTYDFGKEMVWKPPEQSIPISVVAHPNDSVQTSPVCVPTTVLNPIIPISKQVVINEQHLVERPPDSKFDEYCRILSTTLPPPDELFDDGSASSSLCDEEELHDSDDCSMLSVELGLIG